MQILIRDSKELGLAIRRLRLKKDLTQAQLAEQACIRVATISDIENGKTDATLSSVLNMLFALQGELVLQEQPPAVDIQDFLEEMQS